MLATASLFDHVRCQIAALLEIGRLGYQDRHTVFGFKFQRFKPLYQAGKPYGFFGGRAGATSLRLGRAGATSLRWKMKIISAICLQVSKKKRTFAPQIRQGTHAPYLQRHIYLTAFAIISRVPKTGQSF